MGNNAISQTWVTGEENNSAELIKYGDKKLQEEIHAITELTWTSKRMPEEWCNAMICPICKKGDKLQCNN